MMKLSARMKAIADQIPPGHTVADIGTDHALIPIYLYESGISLRIILTDSKEGPLDKARTNLKKMHLLDRISDIRLGDGLSVLEYGEADTIILAGMGGLLISDILGLDIEKTKTFNRFILQPRTAADELRCWLNDNGFSIINERLAAEGNRICEVITTLPHGSCPDKEEFLNDMDFEIPPLLFKLKDPLLGLFMEKKIKEAQEILDNLMKSKSKCADRMKEVTKDRMNRLKEREAQL